MMAINDEQASGAAAQSTSVVQFQVLPKKDPIPTGYGLVTCSQAVRHKQKILTDCPLLERKSASLKNGGFLSGGLVIDSWLASMEFKLVCSEEDAGELTERGVLIALSYALEQDDPKAVKELVASKGQGILSQRLPTWSDRPLAHICAANGSTKTLTLLCEEYPQFIRPQDLDNEGHNALHVLAYYSENVEESARIILAHSSSQVASQMLRHTNPWGFTPLHQAIVCKNTRLCVCLLQYCADQDSNWLALQTEFKARDTALHLAVRKNVIDVVKAILAFPGVDGLDLANKVNKRKETPLHVASWLGHAEICAELLKHGAKINIKDATGRFPITNAFFREKFEALDALLKFLSNKPALINERFQFGFTALHIALAVTDMSSILSWVPSRLLNAEASVEVTNDDGKTPLHISTEHVDTFRGVLACSDLLERPPADRKHWVNMQDLSGWAALHNVVRSTWTDPEVVDLKLRRIQQLIDYGAFVDLRNSNGETPLHIAARNGHEEVVSLLLSSNCLFNSKGMTREKWITMSDFSGETALHEAATIGQRDIVAQLLASCRAPNDLLRVRDVENRTALHWAVQKKDTEMVNEMMQHAGSATKRFLLWNEWNNGTASQDLQFWKSHVSTEPIDPTTLLKTATDELHDLDMARELINSGADVRTLGPDACLWLSTNLRQKASDQPAWEDSLGRTLLVHGIAALLLNPYTGTPITIGVFGDWGKGKSSFMLQVESTLLQMAVQEIFRTKALQNPSSSHNNPLQTILRMIFPDPGEKLRSQVNKALQKCMPHNGNDFNIDTFEIQSEYPELMKDLALTDSSKLSRDHQGKRKAITTDRFDQRDNHISVTTTQALKEAETIGLIPSILIVRYNAWHYENKTQAIAGLAVEISQELERNMTPPQWLRMYCKYSWGKSRKNILMQFLLHIFVFLVAIAIVLPLWKFVPIKKEYKFLGLPAGILGGTWAFFRTLLQFVQPVAQTMQAYIQSPSHISMLGYQQCVIDDIKFLKEGLCAEPSGMWKLICFFGWVFISSSYYIKGTQLCKQHPQKDNFRIVVFIDDLDRCEEKTILEILCAINLILAVCEINVVLGVDKGMVERAINKEFSEGSHFINEVVAEKYLQKIIQLPVQMPDPSGEKITHFLKRQIGGTIENKWLNEDEQEREGHFSEDGIGTSTDDEEIKDEKDDKGHQDVEEKESEDDGVWEKESEDDGVCRQETRLEVARLDETPPLSKQESPRRGTIMGIVISLATKCCFKGANYCLGSKRTRKEVSSTQGAPFHLLLANYSPIETDMLLSLCNLAMGDKRLPREWKRFLNYHRLAWSILSQDRDLKFKEKFKGWQMKLILWIFICWNWREQMDEIIENWDELLLKRQKMQEYLQVEYDTTSEDELASVEQASIGKGLHVIGSEFEQWKRMELNKFSLGDIISVYVNWKFGKLKEENYDTNNRSTQESKIGQQDVGTQKSWKLLQETLKKEYDINFDFIEKFQNFRFFCKLKHLEREISM